MTNAPDTRQTHVVRILGTNKNGDVLPDISADVERIDRAKSATQMAQGFWQGLQRKFRWSDDPTADDYDEEGTPSRDTVIVKVCSPDDNVDDPEEWIPIRVIKSLRARGGSTGDQNYQERLINDETGEARIVKVRRIPHYDTNIDDDAQAAFDASPTLKAYVVPGDQYQKDTKTKDDSQYVEHEIIEYFKPRTNNRVKAGDVDSNQQVKLLNQYLIDESDDAKLDVIGANGINPPYRLDPYQNIVNVQFSARQAAVLGSIGYGPPSYAVGEFTTQVSQLGDSWSGGFGADTFSAASGLGYTVVGSGGASGSGSVDVGSGGEFVAFGKPRDGAACFVAVKGLDVRRGILKNGKLEFTSIATLPASSSSTAAHSISFAGGAFFISYGALANDTSLAVSFDGQSFTMSVNAFSDVQSFANGTEYSGSPSAQPLGGNVAYDNKSKLYVTTGQYIRSYVAHYQAVGDPTDYSYNTFDVEFMSATSSDGISWTAKYETKEGSGLASNPTGIGGTLAASSTVCFAKGRFWAATGFNVQFNDPFYASYLIILPACGVAHSADGRSWTNVRLPGSVVNATFGRGGQTSGYGYCIKFYKTGGVDAAGFPNGFFVVGGIESNNSPDTPFELSKLWVSEDGFGWTVVKTTDNVRHIVLSAINKNVTSGSTSVLYL